MIQFTSSEHRTIICDDDVNMKSKPLARIASQGRASREKAWLLEANSARLLYGLTLYVGKPCLEA